MLHVPPDYELVIRPSRGWFNLNLRDVWRYRDLLFLLVHRDFVAKYKQTVLGPAWFILQPLFMTAVFVVVFSRVAGIPTDGVPPTLFYLAGLLGWSYFAQTLQNASGTLVNNAALFGKVYFPRLVVPLAGVVSNLFAFGLQLATLVVLWTAFKMFGDSGPTFHASAALLWLPVVALQIAALSLGVGLWLSALTSKYRDFALLTPVLLQVWMFASPVIYPLSKIPEQWRPLATMNPMAIPIETVRLAFLGQGLVTSRDVLICATATIVLFITGIIAFSRVEKTFVDTI